jgi:lipoprotein-anchoring transpeptidase ErfK/SrfK
MRTFVILLVIAGLGGGAWWYLPRADAAPMPAADVPLPPPILSGPPTVAAEDIPVPPALQAQWDAAEARWAAAGDQPPTSPQAPAIAAAYAPILRALAADPAQDDAVDRLLADRLTPLGDALFFSRAKYPQDETGTFAGYTVHPGGRPDTIAKQFGMSYGFLNRLRGADPNNGNLQVGDVLKVVDLKTKGGCTIVVSKRRFVLDLYVAGLFARRYAITHGADETPTPDGTTTLAKRELDPGEWKDPKTGTLHRAGEPGFILGPVWLAFDNTTFPRSGIGIHGYTGPDGGMGRKASSGCIRMLNDQVVELYHTLPPPDRALTTVIVGS